MGRNAGFNGLSQGTNEEKRHELNTRARVRMGKYLGEWGTRLTEPGASQELRSNEGPLSYQRSDLPRPHQHHADARHFHFLRPSSASRARVSGGQLKSFLVNYSEFGTVVCILRAQEEICAFFSGRNEAPIMRHSDGPPF